MAQPDYTSNPYMGFGHTRRSLARIQQQYTGTRLMFPEFAQTPQVQSQGVVPEAAGQRASQSSPGGGGTWNLGNDQRGGQVPRPADGGGAPRASSFQWPSISSESAQTSAGTGDKPAWNPQVGGAGTEGGVSTGGGVDPGGKPPWNPQVGGAGTGGGVDTGGAGTGTWVPPPPYQETAPAPSAPHVKTGGGAEDGGKPPVKSAGGGAASKKKTQTGGQ